MIRYDGTVYAWGCYNADSEERIMWRPTELTYFPKNKVKQLACGQNMTVALCAADSEDKSDEQKDMFVCGKFAPLSASNSYKSLKEFRASDQIGNFFVDNQTLYLQVCP